jgi:hypothetical protein
MKARGKGTTALAGPPKRVRARAAQSGALVVEAKRRELVRLTSKRSELPVEQIPGYYLG